MENLSSKQKQYRVCSIAYIVQKEYSGRRSEKEQYIISIW